MLNGKAKVSALPRQLKLPGVSHLLNLSADRRAGTRRHRQKTVPRLWVMKLTRSLATRSCMGMYDEVHMCIDAELATQ